METTKIIRETENKVKQLYTQYPYPAYNPEIDKYAPKKINGISYCFNTLEINHVIYQGQKKNFDNFKVLIAGSRNRIKYYIYRKKS